jgi:LacI family transcriptional regulator
MTHRVTIADVAREVGVSLMTVSRVVNNKEDVSPETRRRVQAVIERLDYRPSNIARGLVTKRTGTLGLVMPDVSNPFFSEVARGAEHVAYAEDYNVFLCNTEEDTQRELNVLQSLEEKQVDGVVLCSSRLEENELEETVSLYPAIVLANRWLETRDEENGKDVVILDDVAGGRMATQHLLDGGHWAVGFLAGPPASYSGRRRLEGYRAALVAAGLSYNSDWTRYCSPTVEGGREIACGLLSAHPELTALFCYNDLVAVGALHACVDLDYAIPGDLAVVGFDDIPLAALVTPSLTTCHVDRYELGARAMRLLLDRISGRTEECQEIVLQPELVVRDSAP